MNGEDFVKAMKDPTRRDAALVEFRAELAKMPPDKLAEIPLNRHERRALKAALPRLKEAAKVLPNLPVAEKERLAAELRAKEPDSPRFEELTALMPFMLEMLEQVDRGGIPAVPPAPDVFQGKETAPVPNNPYSHFVVEAIAKGGPLARYITDGWRENTIDGQPQLLKQAAPWRGGSMVAHFDPVEQQAVNAGELWAKVEGLNPLTADVALAILGTLGDPRQGAKPKYPMLEPVHAGTRNSDH